MKKLNSTVALLAGLVCMILPASVGAQNYDPPGRVARIRYIQGSVSFTPAGESEWVAAVTNRPVTIGDQLWVDADSRAELDAGSAVVRMSANTGISFLNLNDRTLQVQLNQGAINLRVRRLRSGDIVEVDTPNQAFSVTQPGEYRVDAGADGNSSIVVVRQGRGQVTGGGQSYDLYSGQSGRFDGTGTDSLTGQLLTVSSPDDFDRWGESRDSQYDRSQSARYVSPDVVGYEDLDDNGTWQSNPTYGNVWIPTNVQSGWAPYRNGHWAWISPWGWTWVDDAPWGYAPSHYGRWVNVGNRWGWVPGPQKVRPVYAPALVAFIGGSSFGVSVSVGGGREYPGGDVGWFPLAPQDPYVPSYYASRGYVQRVNTSNTVVRTANITNVYNNQVTNNITYVNRTVPGAVTVVPQNVVQSSAPVAKAVVPVDAKRIAAATVATKPSVAPTQASVLGATNTTANRMAHPPAAVATRPVIAKTTPPPPPVPFAKQQQELAKQPGKPLPPQKVQTLRPVQAAEAHPAVKIAPPSKPATLVASKPNAEPAKPGNVPAQQQAAQQQAEKARQQQAQQQAAQQQAEKTRQQQAQQQAAQQQAAQQQAEKARQQQAQQQAAQQQAEKARQQQAQQQQAEKARQQQAQQQAAQQQAPQQQTEKARQQQAQQQQAEKARQQQAQQQAAQQQAEKARQQQAQQEAAQQQARQQVPPPPASARPAQPPQQQAQQQAAQQQAEKARQQQAQQQAVQQQARQQTLPPPASARPAQPPQQQTQQQAAQQQADKARQQQAQQQLAQQQAQQRAAQQQAAQQQARQQAPPPPPASARPAQPPQKQPNNPQAQPNRPLTPEEKAREDKKKREEQNPHPPQ